MSYVDFIPNTSVELDHVLVIIPVLNEEDAIAGVIQCLQSQGLKHIRVVDNGSTDGSAVVASKLGVEVIQEDKQGYGQACWRGLQHLPPQIEWILFCDGDGSDDLNQLSQFWAASGTADFILANRRADRASRSKLTPAQNWGNKLAVCLINWGWGYQYQDLGPLRFIRRAALEKIQMQDRAFGWTVEMQVRAIEEQLEIVEIPVQYHERQGGSSKISGTMQGTIKAGLGILITIAKLYTRYLKKQLQGLAGIVTVLSAVLLLLGCFLIQPQGHFSSTSSFIFFCLGFLTMAIGFGCAGWLPYLSACWFWGVAIATRGILLPMTSGDDIWRYLWEGYLQTQGIRPYQFPPNAQELISHRTEWWHLINHQDISAIYPPIAQLGFRVLAHISLSVLAFKLAFVLADLVICWLLSRRYGNQKATFYAWNPIVLYSFAGGAHYDSWFILPMVAAWLWIEQRRWLYSAFCLGISIGVKWISLPLLAFLLWKLRWQKSLIVLAVASLPLLVTIPAFCQPGSCSLIPFQSSFVVDGRSADFIPYLLTYIWPGSQHLNWIFAIPLSVSLIGLVWMCQRFVSFAEAYCFIVLSLSPVIHGWYFTWIMPFGVASNNWGSRLLSLSSLIYFLLPYRQFAGLAEQGWYLNHWERGLLWLPFIIGFLGSCAFQGKKDLHSDCKTFQCDSQKGDFANPCKWLD